MSVYRKVYTSIVFMNAATSLSSPLLLKSSIIIMFLSSTSDPTSHSVKSSINMLLVVLVNAFLSVW